MNEQKNMILVFRWSVAVSLIASFFAVMLAFSMYSRKRKICFFRH